MALLSYTRICDDDSLQTLGWKNVPSDLATDFSLNTSEDLMEPDARDLYYTSMIVETWLECKGNSGLVLFDL